MDIKTLNNKIFIRGRVINSVRKKFDEKERCHLTYFVVAVERDQYPLRHNKDRHNYFYCYAYEKLLVGGYVEWVYRNIKMYDLVEIKGILDNSPSDKKVYAREVNNRALMSYVSTICLIDVKKIEEEPKDKDKIIPILNKLRKTFGNNTYVEFQEDAFEKDAFGLEKDDDLPDY